jgi:hypothetical protein
MLLVFASRDSNRPEAKAVGELDAKMPKTTQTLYPQSPTEKVF